MLTKEEILMDEELKISLAKESARELFFKHNNKYPDLENYIEDRILRSFEKDFLHVLPFIYEKIIAANQDKWISIDYDNLPIGEVLLLTTSIAILKGDWYENNLVTGSGWRTERSKWASTEDGRNYLTLTPKEDITHWQKLPNPPKQ